MRSSQPSPGLPRRPRPCPIRSTFSFIDLNGALGRDLGRPDRGDRRKDSFAPVSPVLKLKARGRRSGLRDHPRRRGRTEHLSRRYLRLRAAGGGPGRIRPPTQQGRRAPTPSGCRASSVRAADRGSIYKGRWHHRCRQPVRHGRHQQRPRRRRRPSSTWPAAQFFVSDLDTGLIYRARRDRQDDRQLRPRGGRPCRDRAGGCPRRRHRGRHRESRVQHRGSGPPGATRRRDAGSGAWRCVTAASITPSPTARRCGRSVSVPAVFGEDPRLEIDSPSFPGPSAITDIAFDDAGRIYLAQRGDQRGSYDYSAFAEAAQVLGHPLRARPGPILLPGCRRRNPMPSAPPLTTSDADGGVDIGLSAPRRRLRSSVVHRRRRAARRPDRQRHPGQLSLRSPPGQRAADRDLSRRLRRPDRRRHRPSEASETSRSGANCSGTTAADAAPARAAAGRCRAQPRLPPRRPQSQCPAAAIPPTPGGTIVGSADSQTSGTAGCVGAGCGTGTGTAGGGTGSSGTASSGGGGTGTGGYGERRRYGRHRRRRDRTGPAAEQEPEPAAEQEQELAEQGPLAAAEPEPEARASGGGTGGAGGTGTGGGSGGHRRCGPRRRQFRWRFLTLWDLVPGRSGAGEKYPTGRASPTPRVCGPAATR